MFYAVSGTRVGLRAALIFSVGFVAAIGLSDDPWGFLLALAKGVSQGEGTLSILLLFVLLASHSGLAFRAMSDGGRGWVVHLPASRRQRLIGVSIAGALSTFPVVAVWTTLHVAGVALGFTTSALRVAALPLSVAAAVALTLPAERRFVTRALGASASLGVLDGSGWGAVAALVLLGVAAITCGGLETRRSVRPAAEAKIRSARRFSWRIAYRALKSASFAGYSSAYFSGLIPLFISFLFVRNNELSPGLEQMGVRVGCGVASALFVLVLSEQLGRRRPVWAFARSLPWASATRVRHDVELVGLALLPILALGLWMNPRASAPALTVAVFSTLRALASIRPGRRAAERSVVAVSAESVIAALLVGLHPGWALALLPGIAWAAQTLARAERRQRVGAWRELNYAVEGDPTQ